MTRRLLEELVVALAAGVVAAAIWTALLAPEPWATAAVVVLATAAAAVARWRRRQTVVRAAVGRAPAPPYPEAPEAPTGPIYVPPVRPEVAEAALTPTIAACGGPPGCLCQAGDDAIYRAYADYVTAEHVREQIARLREEGRDA